ncbi:MAG: hypothetical protein K1Y36_19075 [Blastocatellia bacterium]|nr:hypothetical protein [Blastocatellia bacterium]
MLASFRRIGLLLAFGLTIASLSVQAQGTAGQRLDFRFQAQPFSNLCYQLDAMAGLIPASAEAYRELWKTKLNWGDEDERQLKTWENLRGKYRQNLNFSDYPPEFPYPANPPAVAHIELDKKMRIAGLLATTPDEYRKLLATVMLPPDVDPVVAVVRHFQPRFQSWWETEGRQIVESKTTEFPDLMKRTGLYEFCDRVTRFYGSTIADGYSINLFLIARPQSKTPYTSAEVFENFSTVEVVAGEKVEQRIDVVLHEVFHHLLSLSPEEKRFELIQDFARSGNVNALATYNILDEALATGFGNGLVAQKVMSPQRFTKYQSIEQSFYNDPFIDKVAKALMPILAKRLEAGKNLFDGFVPEYVQSAAAALGDSIGDPHLRLFVRTAVFTDDSFFPLARLLGQGIRGGYTSTYVGNEGWVNGRKHFERFPAANGLLVVKTADLPKLAAWQKILGAKPLQAIRQAAKKQPAVVYAVRRSPQSVLYVIVGKDAAEIEPAFKKFIANHREFEGFLAL